MRYNEEMRKDSKIENPFAGYKQKLLERKGDSRAYSKHQVFGLMIAELLEDFAHKSLYIKLAKERSAEELLRIAKEVAEKNNIKNKGAYFMRVIYSHEK